GRRNFNKKKRGAAGGGGKGAAGWAKEKGEKGPPPPADSECQPHRIAGRVRYDAENRKNPRPHHSTDTDRNGSNQADVSRGSGRRHVGRLGRRHGSANGSISEGG